MQTYLTICTLCLLQGIPLCQYNRFCGQVELPSCFCQRMTSSKRNAMNQLPLDLQLPTILSQPSVAFHLLPLSGGIPKAPSVAKASNPKKRSRSPRKQQPVKAKEGQKVAQVKIVAKHSSRSHQQSPGDASEATPLLGVQRG